MIVGWNTTSRRRLYASVAISAGVLSSCSDAWVIGSRGAEHITSLKAFSAEEDPGRRRNVQEDLESTLRELVKDKSVFLERDDDDGSDRTSSLTKLMEAYALQREDEMDTPHLLEEDERSRSTLKYNESELDEFLDEGWGEVEDGVLSSDDADAFLDSDGYLEASQNIGKDGEIMGDDELPSNRDLYETIVQKLTEPDPYSPGAGMTQQEDDPDADMQNVWEAMQNIKQPSPERLQQEAEELHRKVFEHEQGYLEQDAVFRQALRDDNTTSATAQHRNKRVEQKLSRAHSILEANLAEFEKEYMQNPPENRPVCCECGCFLSPDERNDICQLCHAEKLLAEGRKLERNRRQYRTNPQNSNDPLRLRRPVPQHQQQTNKMPTPTATPARRSENVSTRNSRASPPEKQRAPQKRPIRNIQEQNPVTTSRAPSDSSGKTASPDEEARRREEFRRRFQSLPPRDARKTPSQAWEEVTDPDSGEVFYWNKESEEMRWEL